MTLDAIATDSSASAAFGWPLRVYWEDTDAGGVVYYANYLKFFERARSEWLRSKGLHQQQLRLETGAVFVVSQAHIYYRQSARLDDELWLTVEPTKAVGACLYVQQQAWRHNATPVLLCQAEVRVAWVGASGKPQRIPAYILDKLL